jgi:hypothetical protein
MEFMRVRKLTVLAWDATARIAGDDHKLFIFCNLPDCLLICRG